MSGPMKVRAVSKTLCERSKRLCDEAYDHFQRSRDALSVSRKLQWKIEQRKKSSRAV